MPYRNPGLDMPGRIAHMRGLCDSEPGPGVLAFVDGQVAGWCSIAPKATYRALVNSRTIPHVDDAGAWSAVCLVVGVGFRRRGLMRVLLDGVVGTVGLFEAHGFRRVLPTTGRRGGKPRWLVRRELRRSPSATVSVSLRRIAIT